MKTIKSKEAQIILELQRYYYPDRWKKEISHLTIKNWLNIIYKKLNKIRTRTKIRIIK